METVTDKLDKICLTAEMADVLFSFQGENVPRIPAHKMILALRSPVFKDMFYGSFPLRQGEIRIEGITWDIFRIFLKYLYSDHLQLSKDSVIPLLNAAQKYQIGELISKCENYLQDNLAVNNACTLFNYAKVFTMDKIQTTALRFIADNAFDVLKNDDFLLLSSENLVDILKFDYLCVQEVGVILAVLRWVDHKLTNSKIKVDGKSRRAVLLKDEEEELQILKKDVSIPNSLLSCGKFMVRPREGPRVMEISVDDILNPGKVPNNTHNQWVTLQEETFSIKANKLIKIKSVNIKPQYQHPPQNSGRFNVNIQTQSLTISQNRPSKRQRVNGLCSETEEGTDIVDVKLEGKDYKLPIDKVLQQNEMLVLTIRPPSNQHAVKMLLHTYTNFKNGMMYQHDISNQTTLYLSLTGGHLVESFEVTEIC
ncbi:BTBD3_6 [Mytilus edulis]|uniref:BTBD3_6 n=1 Tax=Mytilus edulis TaxID=6550 RepID=A0A8S3RMU3_MYTED|nr:BTBD3_6 [Mytilus edulis]